MQARGEVFWVREKGFKKGEKALLPSIPEGVFPRRFIPEESAIRRKTGMTFGDFQQDLTPMNNDSTRHVQQMKPQSLQPGGPPRTGQTLSFHHREDIVGQDIQAKPSGIGKEPFAGHTAAPPG